MVRTAAFQAVNLGSIPGSATKLTGLVAMFKQTAHKLLSSYLAKTVVIYFSLSFYNLAAKNKIDFDFQTLATVSAISTVFGFYYEYLAKKVSKSFKRHFKSRFRV